jgi:hypothetical protein
MLYISRGKGMTLISWLVCTLQRKLAQAIKFPTCTREVFTSNLNETLNILKVRMSVISFILWKCQDSISNWTMTVYFLSKNYSLTTLPFGAFYSELLTPFQYKSQIYMLQTSNKRTKLLTHPTQQAGLSHSISDLYLGDKWLKSWWGTDHPDCGCF